jgi:hypothetical protein
LQPDVVVYNSCISACGKGQEWENAMCLGKLGYTKLKYLSRGFKGYWYITKDNLLSILHFSNIVFSNTIRLNLLYLDFAISYS